MLTTLALAAVILGAYTTQAMIGFGANIIALTIGAHLWPLEQLLPVVVALNLPLSGSLVWKYRHEVAWRTLARTIAPAFAIGFIAGIAASQWLQSRWLALGFGVLVSLIAAWELLRINHPRRAAHAAESAGFLLLGGVAQGLYASGGPFVAYATDRLGLGRSAFRATLLVVWLVTNSILLLSFAINGSLSVETGKNFLLFLPLIALGLWLGEKLHAAVSERVFRQGLYTVLLVAGLILVARHL